MDLTASIAPRSDQVNADDLIIGPMTVTIERVAPGSDEQPVNVVLVETPGRAYRPSKTMRRLMVAAWGKDSSAYIGRRLVLVRNPDITFGRDKVGGIEIAAMSHLEKPLTIALTATRGKKRTFTVQPLVEPLAVPMASKAQIDALVAALNAAGYATAPQKTAAIAGALGEPRKPADMTAEEADVLTATFEARVVGADENGEVTE